jgi:hypothetical protein
MKVEEIEDIEGVNGPYNNSLSRTFNKAGDMTQQPLNEGNPSANSLTMVIKSNNKVAPIAPLDSDTAYFKKGTTLELVNLAPEEGEEYDKLDINNYKVMQLTEDLWLFLEYIGIKEITESDYKKWKSDNPEVTNAPINSMKPKPF